MSYDMTDAVFSIELPASDKLVLLVLAHCHNGKTGQCNPAVSRISSMAGVSVRNVSYALNRLRDRGLIEYQSSNGRRSNSYKLTFKPCKHCRVNADKAPASNPATTAPNPATTAANPATAAYKQVKNKEGTGNKTHKGKNPTVNSKPLQPAKEETMIDPRLLPAFIDHDIWQDFRESRRQSRAKMTELAEKYLLREMQKLHSAGYDVNECMVQSICNGWRGIFPPKNSSKPKGRNHYDRVQAAAERLGLNRTDNHCRNVHPITISQKTG